MKTINEQVFDALKTIGSSPVLSLTPVVFMEKFPELAPTKEIACTRLSDLYTSGRAKRRGATPDDKSKTTLDGARWAYYVTAAKYAEKPTPIKQRGGLTRKRKVVRGEVMLNRLLKRAERMQIEMNAMLECITELAKDYTELSDLAERIKEFNKK